MAPQAEAEGEGGRFGQFRHHPPPEQPVVGFQPADARTAGVEHQAQGVLGAQQRHSIPQQVLFQMPRLLQSPLQPPSPVTGLPLVQAGFAGGQQQRTGAGGLQPAQAALDRLGIHAISLQPEHSRLGQAAGGFLQGVHHQVSTASYSTGR